MPGADGAEARGAGQSAVRPLVGLGLPDSRIGFVPALLDRLGRRLGCTPALGVEAVLLRGSGEQQQGFPEGVELELAVRVVADDGVTAWIAGEIELPLVRHRAAADGVDGPERCSILEQTVLHEANRVVEHRPADARGRLARVALIANPGV